jgi:hypothetical protein
VVVQRRQSACGNHSGESRTLFQGLKLFGFIAELVFASSRNSVRDHPGFAFTLTPIPPTILAATQTGASVPGDGRN